ncbi:MAG: cupin domain-containing protein [Gemmatimonadaceae bacterium]|nr:cupin domain-containing protein [Gemmatimonadaceae bacterium]
MTSARNRRPAAYRTRAASLLGSTTLALLLAGCGDSERSANPTAMSPTAPQRTLGSGSKSTLVGRGTFAEGFKVKRKSADWDVEVKAPNGLDVAVQSITFEPGGQSGWHRHPGPVFISVVSGTMTFYDSDDPTCTPIIRSAGQGFLDVGDHAHIARNESGSPAMNVVTYFAPPGALLRIDAPKPGNCPF